MGFTLTVRFGRGTTVETFAAVLEHGGDRMDVAIKRLRPELRANQKLAEALIAWGKEQLDLDDPHLVATLEAGSTPEGAYVIQERVDGPPLSRVLLQLRKSRRMFKPELAIAIAAAVSEGLAAIHARAGGVHGALDPGEVLISFRGVVKVGDQALHRLDPLVDPPPVLEPTYLAPEVQAGGAPSPSADAYSLALMTIEMLLGEPVWTREKISVQDALRALSDFSQLAQAQPALSADLAKVLGRALDPDPSRRFAGGAEMHAALAPIQKRHQVAADAKTLGPFVRALVPLPTQEDALTTVAGSAGSAGSAGAPGAPPTSQPEKAVDAGFKAFTMAIDPEVEAYVRGDRKRALSPAVRKGSSRSGSARAAIIERTFWERLNGRLHEDPKTGWLLLGTGGVLLVVLLFLVVSRVMGD
ncbi:MAG: protein kinase [Deltaproteobacteria bacterium]|nr:protein kinase [Deltaproteobacteria bacterium]